MYGTLARSTVLGRNVMRNFIRNGSHGGVPCETLPFSIKNRYRLTWNFFWFTTTGFSLPYIVLMYQMKKK